MSADKPAKITTRARDVASAAVGRAFGAGGDANVSFEQNQSHGQIPSLSVSTHSALATIIPFPIQISALATTWHNLMGQTKLLIEGRQRRLLLLLSNGVMISVRPILTEYHFNG